MEKDATLFLNSKIFDVLFKEVFDFFDLKYSKNSTILKYVYYSKGPIMLLLQDVK